MRFERNKISKDSIGVGSSKIALHIDRVLYSITANDYKIMKIHEFIALINLWKTDEWKKAPDIIKDRLLKHNITIHLSGDDPNMPYISLKLTDIEDEYLKFKDGQVIHYNLKRYE